MISAEPNASAGGPGTPPSPDQDNPWPGLASFTEEQRGIFHGRQQETAQLVRLVRRHSLTVLFGQSGLGKSSLLRAGAFPLLREADYLPLYVRLDHDATAPALAGQIKAALVDAYAAAGAEGPVPRGDETLWEYFHRKDIDIWSAKNRLLTVVLAIDQFEEIFTLGRADAARRARGQAFLAELTDLAENRPPAAVRAKFDSGELDPTRYAFDKPACHVILSLREDFLPDLEGLKGEMRSILHNRMRITRLDGLQALEIVTKPAPHLLAEGVAERIVEFVAGARSGSVERLAELAVEPALLSVICRELNERRRALGHAQISADLVSGNRREILSDFYARSIGDLPEAMRRFVEDRLLTKSGFRDNLALENALEFPGVTRPLIDTLVSRRLLRIEDRLGVQRVELTHDVLADVIRASRDARQQRLAEAEARVRTRNLRMLVGGLTAIVLLLIGAGAYGLHARRLEFQRASRNDARIGSQLLDDGRVGDGLAQLIRAGRKDPHNPIIAPRLASALASRQWLLPEATPLAHAARVVWQDFSEDGKSLGLLWEDGIHARLDLASGNLERWKLGAPPRRREPPLATGRHLVIPCEDGVLRVLGRDGRLVRELRFDHAVVALSTGHLPQAQPGDLIAATLANQTIVIANVATGAVLGAPIAAAKPTYLTIGPKWLAWAEAPDRARGALAPEARLRDTDAGATEIVLRVPEGGFDWVTSPSGRHAAVIQRTSANPDLFLRLWSLPEGRPLTPPSRVDAAVFAPALRLDGVTVFSPDGRHLITWYATLEIWNADTAQRVARIASVGSYSGSKLKFSPDGRTLATWSNIGSLDLWDLATGERRVPPLKHTGNVSEATFSADSDVLLTSATDGFARLWDAKTGRLLFDPVLRQESAPQAALARDGQRLAIGTRSGEVYRFRLGGAAAKSLVLPANRLLPTLPFMPDAPSRLLFLDTDRARVIDVATGREVGGGFPYPEPIRFIGNSFTRIRQDFKVMVVKTVPGEWHAWWIGQGRIDKVVKIEGAPVTASDSMFGYVEFSPTGDMVVLIAAAVAGRDSDTQPGAGQIRAWDLRTGQPAGPAIAADPSPLATYFPKFSPDGRRLTLGSTLGQSVKIWDRATGKVVADLGPDSVAVRMVVFHPDGSRVATANRGPDVRLWDTATGAQVGPPLFHSDGVYDAEFSPDGLLLATYSADGVLRFWHGRTGEPVGLPVENRRGSFRLVRFSADGQRVVTANNDGTTRIWDVATGLPLIEPLDHAGIRIPIAEFSPDERFVRTELNAQVGFHIWSVPTAPRAGATTPPWLLDLAEICATKTLDADGQFTTSARLFGKLDDIRRAIAALPADSPYVEWGRWFLADPTTRSIAPGFVLTAAEAESFAASLRGANAASSNSGGR